MINWDAAADALAHGDLRDLPDSVAEAILALSWHEEVRAAVLGLGIDCLRSASMRQAARSTPPPHAEC